MALSDLLGLLFAGTVAYFSWAVPVHHQTAALYLPVVPLALLVTFGYGQAGLYPGFGLGPVETLRRYWLVTGISFVVLASLTFALKIPPQYSRVTFSLAFLLSLITVPAFRLMTVRLARARWWWPEPAVLVRGAAREGPGAQILSEGHHGDFRLLETIPVNDESQGVEAGRPGCFETARAWAEAGVKLVFTELRGSRSEAYLGELRMIFPRVIILRGFDELPVEGVQIRNLGGVLGLEYTNNLLRPESRWVKRALDVLLAVPGFLLSAPVILISALLVKVFSPGPAFFQQDREGRHGRTIRVPKLRTMTADAEREIERLLRADPEIRDRWEEGFKLKNDPRIIPGVGRILRRFSIDELPQLWSVIKGEMSLVGPRPFPEYHLSALSAQARALRNAVRPGITGLWQVSARGVADVETQQAYDVYYVRNWSLWLDLYILGKTLYAVLSGEGAH